jgi:hypothetical protein
MKFLTDNRTALDKFKMQGGFNISKAPSTTSDYIKLCVFQKEFKKKTPWLIEELTKLYGKLGINIFQNFEDAILKGNDVAISIIDRCEKDGSILNEIIRRSENKRLTK